MYREKAVEKLLIFSAQPFPISQTQSSPVCSRAFLVDQMMALTDFAFGSKRMLFLMPALLSNGNT